MGKTVLVDLSHPFGRGNPLWPSNGDFHIDRVQHMPMHYRLLQTFNDFHMHNSTHADSPSHVIPESPYTHELPLENYYGPAVCLDIPKKHWELITVEDIEPMRAKAIVDEVTKSASNYIGDIMEMVPPKVIEDGVVAVKPSSPSVKKNAAVGGLGLAVLVCGLICLKTVLDDTIKSEEDIEKYLGLSVLAVIPDTEKK